MRRARSAVSLVVPALVLLLLSMPRTTPRAADSGGSLVPLEVQSRALREGSARVIVELQLPGPHVPNGPPIGAVASAQRADIAAVQSQRPPMVTAHDGLMASAVAIAGYESAATKSAVKVA